MVFSLQAMEVVALLTSGVNTSACDCNQIPSGGESKKNGTRSISICMWMHILWDTPEGFRGKSGKCFFSKGLSCLQIPS